MTQADKLKQQLAKKQPQQAEMQKQDQTVSTLVEQMKPHLKNALPNNMSEDRMVRLLVNALTKNPKLQQADRISFLAAAMEAAQLGLEPNTSLGHCYIIPYNRGGKTVAEFQMGYKGMLQLAYNTGEYKMIYAEPVYQNDQFHRELGLFKELKHVPADVPDGHPIYYYAVYHLKNGGYDFKVMSWEAIGKHASKYSKSLKGNSSPWRTDFDSMALKTVLLQALKYAPKSIEIQRAIEADGTTKFEVSENMSDVIDADYEESESSNPFDDNAFQFNQGSE